MNDIVDVDRLQKAFDSLCKILSGLAPLGLSTDSIKPQTLLVEDIGLDSLLFVDLTLGIEDVMGFEFPMQKWVDQQIDTGAPLSVGELAKACSNMPAIESAP